MRGWKSEIKMASTAQLIKGRGTPNAMFGAYSRKMGLITRVVCKYKDVQHGHLGVRCGNGSSNGRELALNR